MPRSGDDSDDDHLPIHRDDEEDDDQPTAKKSRNIWSDMLVEESLMKKGNNLTIDKPENYTSTVARGPETYSMPNEERDYKKIEKREKNKNPEVFVTPANDDVFGGETSAPTEQFGVKKDDPKKFEGWWCERGQAKKFSNQRAFPTKQVSFNFKKKESLLSAEFTLKSFLESEIPEGLSLEQLGDEIARTMGEKDPETVKKIVNAIGNDAARKLFNDTQYLEKNGGVKTNDGSRRRTPGGVFILLFKTDCDISKEKKDEVFGILKQNVKQIRKEKRKRAHGFSAQLDEVKRTMNEVKRMDKIKQKQDNNMETDQ